MIVIVLITRCHCRFQLSLSCTVECLYNVVIFSKIQIVGPAIDICHRGHFFSRSGLTVQHYFKYHCYICYRHTFCSHMLQWNLFNIRCVSHKEITHIDGLVEDCSISSALAVEILQSCTKPSIYGMTIPRAEWMDGLVQERRNSIANALELRLPCTNSSTWIRLRTHRGDSLARAREGELWTFNEYFWEIWLCHKEIRLYIGTYYQGLGGHFDI